MIAILHYALLKGTRDKSTVIFLLTPITMVVASLIGVVVASGHPSFPLYYSLDWTPAQNASQVAFISTMCTVCFASLSGFWMFRSEVATRAIGSFVLAKRPIVIILAMIVHSSAIAVLSWIPAIAAARVLTGAAPPDTVRLTLAVIVISIASSAMGAMFVMISAQPQMLIGAYCGSCFFLPFLVLESNRPKVMMLAVVTAVLSTTIATFLLERRCTT